MKLNSDVLPLQTASRKQCEIAAGFLIPVGRLLKAVPAVVLVEMIFITVFDGIFHNIMDTVEQKARRGLVTWIVSFRFRFVFIATRGGIHSTARLPEGPCASPASSTEGGRKREERKRK